MSIMPPSIKEVKIPRENGRHHKPVHTTVCRDHLTSQSIT